MRAYRQKTTEKQDHYIRSILEGFCKFSRSEITIRQEKLQLSWLLAPFIVVIIAPEYTPISYEDKDDIIQCYKDQVHYLVREQGYAVYCLTNALENVVCLLSLTKKDHTASFVDASFCDIYKKLVTRFRLDLFIGIGNIVDLEEKIHFSHAEASEMLGYKYQYAARGVISAANIVKYKYASAISDDIAFRRVIGCFIDGNIGKLSVRLDELIAEIRFKPNVSHTSIKRTLAELLIHILHIASNSNQAVERVLAGRDPYNWILEQGNTPAIREWILSICSELIQLRQEISEIIEKEIIKKAKTYIYDNLGSVDLNLQTISDYIGLTAPYFSQLFSSEVGEGVIAYVTKQRMERASQLLKSTDLKIGIISAQLGYNSTNYFIQVFRRNFGASPLTYRKDAAHT